MSTLQFIEPFKQQDFIAEIVTEELCQILGISKENIPQDKGINFLGVDSLLLLQLIGALSHKLAIDLSPAEFVSGQNLKQITKTITDKMTNSSFDGVVYDFDRVVYDNVC